MVKPTPPLAERACGALAGHAAGSPTGAEIWLATMLAEELLEPAIDLRRLALRWAERARKDGADLDDGTRVALAEIDATGVPPDAPAVPPGEDRRSLSRLVPIALATLQSPRNLVSATWHIAALTAPDSATAWAQVAVNVAAARLLLGHCDFIPDVIEALRANGAPPELVDAVRRVPRGRELLAATCGSMAAETLQAALWFAYHERQVGRAMRTLGTLAATGTPVAAPALALLGARDGETALRDAGLPEVPAIERLRTLAKRLVGAAESA